MEEALAAIEQLDAVAALKSSFFIYPLVNALHILAIGVLVTAAALMDLRIIGAFRSMPEARFETLMRRIAIGAFVFALASGLALFSVRAREYAGMPLFWLKLALIGIAGVNAMAFSVVRGGGARKAMAALSMGLWVSVLVAGRFLGFVI